MDSNGLIKTSWINSHIIFSRELSAVKTGHSVYKLTSDLNTAVEPLKDKKHSSVARTWEYHKRNWAIVAIKRKTLWDKYSERSLNIKFTAILDILLASGRKNVLGFLFSSMELIVVFRMNINYRIIFINTRSTYRYNSLKYRRLRQSNTYTGLIGLIHLN